MTWVILHSFDPATASPVTGPSVSDIDDAGIREAPQTPGAAYGGWSAVVRQGVWAPIGAAGH
jgi:hypothetical protein